MPNRDSEELDEQAWARKQKRISNTSTALTAAGATALGTMLAGKTKAAKKVLGPKIHRKLQSGKADDLRNTVALASMVSGVASGVNWSKKLAADAKKASAAASGGDGVEKAANYAAAMDISKGIVPSGARATLRGLRPRRAYYRRTPLPRVPGMTRRSF